VPVNGVIPPGGIAGFAQMTPASRLALFPPGRSNGGTRRRRRSSKKKIRASGRKRSRKSGGRKMKFGSPAWQKKYKVGKFRK